MEPSPPLQTRRLILALLVVGLGAWAIGDGLFMTPTWLIDPDQWLLHAAGAACLLGGLLLLAFVPRR